MMINKLKIILLCLITVVSSNCSSQKQKNNNTKQDYTTTKLLNRKASAAGRFYSSSPEELKSNLQLIFSKAEPKSEKNVMAIISPHAGYSFSGEVAASAYNQIDNEKHYNDIFIIASSHYTSFKGASIYSLGNYETPLGEVEVDIPLANKLKNDNDVFTYYPEAHKEEHSLENQLPFLQYIMKTDFKIIPIVIGSQTTDVSQQIAAALKPYFNEKNLFIISSDFSHYPKYDDAKIVDKATAEDICKNSPDALLASLISNEKENISNLATSLCGWTSVMSLLYITKGDTDIEYIPIKYKNSGDVYGGDKNRVVGYYALAVTRKDNTEKSEIEFNLTKDEKEKLLKIARETIKMFLADNTIPEIDEETLTKNMMIHAGAFVTLNKHHQLRGCIGRFTADIPLYRVVQEMAVAAATQDRRFTSVSSNELGDLDIEISVLTPLKKIKSIDEIELGKHGIYIKKGYNTGTFLPQVATETGWNKEEFLGHCSRDKAGLGWDDWKNAEIYTYEALVFSEEELDMK